MSDPVVFDEMGGEGMAPREAYAGIEGSKGELGFYIVSDGTNRPYRWHERPSSFMNLKSLEVLAIGRLIADVIAIIKHGQLVIWEPLDELRSRTSLMTVNATAGTAIAPSIPGKVVHISPGPVVTTFEFKPDAGVKYAKITGLAEDLCLAMQAESVLIDPEPTRTDARPKRQVQGLPPSPSRYRWSCGRWWRRSRPRGVPSALNARACGLSPTA